MAGNPKPTKIFKFGGYLIFCAGTQNNHIEALLYVKINYLKQSLVLFHNSRKIILLRHFVFAKLQSIQKCAFFKS